MTVPPNLSSRLAVSFDTTEYAALIEERRRTDNQLLDLAVSNPTETLHEYPHGAISTVLGRVREFKYQPDPFGLAAAREVIAQYYASGGVQIPIERIVLTASTSEAYSLLFKLLCDPGDEVLIPQPSYPLFEHLARFECVRVRPYQLRYDGAWHIDFASLETGLTPRTRAVVVVNPNNPTGSFLKRHEAEQLAHWAAVHDAAIISDEVFTDYKWQPDDSIVHTLSGVAGFLGFCLNGLSKLCGMPQMKLGWIVLNGSREQLRYLRPRLELIFDTYLSVNSPVQMALGGLMQIGSQIRQSISSYARENLTYLLQTIAHTPIHCLTAEGGWTAVLRLPRLQLEEDWSRGLLIEQSVLVQPGFFFDMTEGPYSVVSLITPPVIFREGIDRIVRYAANIEATRS